MEDDSTWIECYTCGEQFDTDRYDDCPSCKAWQEFLSETKEDGKEG